ncbi:MAG TPA: hypothetical protein PKY81_09715 [bacterium]|nr:hypothetical protein [bacterium]
MSFNQTHQLSLFILMLIISCIFMSCGKKNDTGNTSEKKTDTISETSFTPEKKIDAEISKQIEKMQNQKIPDNSKISQIPKISSNSKLLLSFVNHWATTEDVLKYSVNLSLTQAQNILNHKKGNDGIYGTIDDNIIENIQELGGIPSIDNAAIGAIESYARKKKVKQRRKSFSDEEAPTDYHYVLKYLDNKTLRYWKLEKVLNLDNDVVENIYNFRSGEDYDINTADDKYFKTISLLDSIHGIDSAALQDILTKCRKRKIEGAENIYSASISWPRNHRLTTFIFDISAMLGLEKNITRQNTLQSSSFVLTFYDTEFFNINLKWNSIADTIWEANYKADTGINEFQGYIYWISDTQARFNGYIKGNPVEYFPETLEDTFTQQWNFQLRLGNNPFAIYDTIGDDEFLKMKMGTGTFPRTYWVYSKYGDFPAELDSDNDGLGDNYERSIETDSYYSDNDGEGINDYNEIAIFHTKPDDTDSDKDGISDYIEIYGTNGYITNPLLYDTDGDSVYDGYEVQYALDPLSIDSDKNGISDGLEDIDEDGYVNWIEAENNTDPTKSDSPEEGLPFIMYFKEIKYGPGGGGDIQKNESKSPAKLATQKKKVKKTPTKE